MKKVICCLVVCTSLLSLPALAQNEGPCATPPVYLLNKVEVGGTVIDNVPFSVELFTTSDSTNVLKVYKGRDRTILACYSLGKGTIAYTSAYWSSGNRKGMDLYYSTRIASLSFPLIMVMDYGEIEKSGIRMLELAFN